MTDDSTSSLPSNSAASTPFGLRVAAILTLVCGIVTGGTSILTGLPLGSAATWKLYPLLVGGTVGALLCVAAYLVVRGKRSGGILVVLGCAVPTIAGLLVTGQFRLPPLLLILATLTVLVHWKLLS